MSSMLNIMEKSKSELPDKNSKLSLIPVHLIFGFPPTLVGPPPVGSIKLINPAPQALLKKIPPLLVSLTDLVVFLDL